MPSSTFWGRIKYALSIYFSKENVIKFIKGHAITFALKKILGSAALGGFKAWLVKYIVTNFFEELGEPLIKAGINYVGYTYDKVEGKVLIKRIKKASDDGNQTDYDNTTDDIFK